jgi:putative PIN family toxin of toxin-antitoxin system
VRLVLDTNVVIDWLVFDDAFLASFREQVHSRSVQIVSHLPALVELRRVLGYPVLRLSTERQAAVLGQYEALVSFFGNEPVVADSPKELPVGFPRCRDPDDDPFLWLAWQAQADALVSRDKAVLKLAKRARKFGFQVYDVPTMVAVLGSAPALTASAGRLPAATT